MLALVAASFALNASKIPFAGPIAAVRVGRIQDNWVLNPTFQQLEYSDMELVVAGSKDSIMMVEGGALEVSEEDVVEALTVAQERHPRADRRRRKSCSSSRRSRRRRWRGTKAAITEGLARQGASARRRKISEALNQKDKHTRIAGRRAGEERSRRAAARRFPRQRQGDQHICSATRVQRAPLAGARHGKRVDGRKPNEVRPITIDTSLLPRAHGSALFTRGQTQALVAVTLGTANDVAASRLDRRAASETTQSFMLHYNFPPFSTGEVRPMRGTSRREIGHGNLAERAMQGVLPAFEDFPYTIRIVSDILESNGSSSMASVCGGSLALFDAGVPIRAAVAGVAMGLIKEGKKYAILTDILGTEDHLGDMDFKVAGTRNGITSIQMDIKIEGLDLQIMKEALAQAKEGRLHILGEMDKALAEPRADLSAVRAAHRDDEDQPREDRRPDRTEGQDDPRHSGRDGRGAHRRRHGSRHDRRRRRRSDGARASDGAGAHRRAGRSARRTRER